MLSIIKTAENYDGEYDFKNDNGVFVFRLVMNIPQPEHFVPGNPGDNMQQEIL